MTTIIIAKVIYAITGVTALLAAMKVYVDMNRDDSNTGRFIMKYVIFAIIMITIAQILLY